MGANRRQLCKGGGSNKGRENQMPARDIPANKDFRHRAPPSQVIATSGPSYEKASQGKNAKGGKAKKRGGKISPQKIPQEEGV